MRIVLHTPHCNRKQDALRSFQIFCKRLAVHPNSDQKTVQGFGQEWQRFDQSHISESESFDQFLRYFSVFPWAKLPQDAVGFDMGCGSGRWAKHVAPKVGKLYCIDASQEALDVAKRNLQEHDNVVYQCASVECLSLAENSQDFGYSLGVLHHIPNTAAALKSCWKKLKPGAPFLIYMYYAFDHKPWWFKKLWRATDMVRTRVCRLPFSIRSRITDAIAVCVYWPLARLASLLAKMGKNVDNFPLSQYRFHSFYTMRTDALDRFGTRLEQRFTLAHIQRMMENAGFENLAHRTDAPFWCVCGIKK